jgi:S1-C subfamily serine protease
VNPGASGGPLFSAAGNVIGLVTLKTNIEAVGFAVPLERLARFLESSCTDGLRK